MKGQQFLFSSKEFDEETRLHYFGARYYDPRLATWKSADPMLEQYLSARGPADGLKRPIKLAVYAHGRQHPLGHVDPDGLRPLTEGEINFPKAIYNDKVDYKKIDVKSDSSGSFWAWLPVKTDHAVTLDNDIYFPKSGYLEDFSKGNVYEQAWLVQEVGRVWQHQTNPKYSWREATFDRKYEYELTPGKKLLDYGWEQQPSVIADSFLLGKGYKPGSLKGGAATTPAMVPDLTRKYETLLGPYGLGPRKESTAPPAAAPKVEHE